jgi:undecaprenyl-diphosphatase
VAAPLSGEDREHLIVQLASISGLDRALFEWVVDHRLSVLNSVLVVITYLGTGGTPWLALALLLALGTRRPLLPIGILAAAIVWGSDGLASLLKAVTGRPRPFVSIHHVHVLINRPASGSMPSAHATTAFAGALLLGWLWPRWRIGFLALATVIAFSRVYVGVHYPADVLAGAALGSAVAFAGIALAGRTRFRGGFTGEGAGVRP